VQAARHDDSCLKCARPPLRLLDRVRGVVRHESSREPITSDHSSTIRMFALVEFGQGADLVAVVRPPRIPTNAVAFRINADGSACRATRFIRAELRRFIEELERSVVTHTGLAWRSLHRPIASRGFTRRGPRKDLGGAHDADPS
jgi:hypothetical protein